MKTLSILKKSAVAIAMVGSVVSAQAAITDLGTITAGPTPTTFQGYTASGAFNDVFSFFLPANSASGYTVTNFTAAGSLLNSVFSTFSLGSDTDGTFGNGGETILKTITATGGNTVSFDYPSTPSGNYFLIVTGFVNGTAGGLYNGAFSVTAPTLPVPEPETYAMLLAGLGVMGVIARRRNKKAA